MERSGTGKELFEDKGRGQSNYCGVQIYHNYVRPLMGSDGRTPGEVAGIEVKGNDKWVLLIQNAARKR
jgi:hypothetical protein